MAKVIKNQFKKVEKLNSSFIKLQLMKYFRFDRNYTLCCSECINHSDINAVNDKDLVEVEIKISKQDFLAEFKGDSRIKAYKHDILNHFGEKKPKYGYITPNFYYFCVTSELKSYVLDYLNANYPNYGLLVCDNYRQYGRRSHIYCVKRAKRIHDTPPSQRVFIRIYKRVQSELITLKEKLLSSNIK